jgi:hypothetical protein
MTHKPAISRIRTTLLAAVTVLFGACASTPRVTVSQTLDDTADHPYSKVLVVVLFSSFDPRRYLETEIVERLNAVGVEAVRSTSMMDTRTPVVAQTFLDMVDEIGADAVVLTQLTGAAADATAVDARPEATRNYWPTYYYNVFETQLTEYVEPPRVSVDWTLVLATQIFSVEQRAPIWGIETHSKFTEIQEDGLDYGIYEREADAIVDRMLRDGVVRQP